MIKERIQQEIEMFSRVGHSALMQRFILKHGLPFTEHTKVELGTQKECFKNAATLALSSPSYRYYEGYILRAELPLLIHHAWCVNGEAKIADPTLRDSSNTEYYGAEFDHKILLDELLRNKVYGLLDTGVSINVRLIKKLDPQLVKEFLKRS